MNPRADFEYQRYVLQSNRVYWGSVAASAIYTLIFYGMGLNLLVWTSLAMLGITVIALALNKKHPNLAALVFIAPMSVHGAFLLTQLGLSAGFGFFLLNLSGVIIFTGWTKQQRFVGVVLEVILLIGAYWIVGGQGPAFTLGTTQSYTLLAMNSVINVVGITNSVAYFRTIVDQNNTRLIDLSITDPLTQAYNRGYFDVKITEEMTRIERHPSPLSIITFDLDLFKQVNDRFGHPVGDDVLKQLVNLTKLMVRNTDLLFRLGGEEFVLMLPETNGAGAYVVARKIQHALRQNVHPVAGTFTASFGIAQYHRGETLDDFYHRADKNLYAAKRSGRDLIISDDADILVPLEWDPLWESGHPRIDAQHKALVDFSNAILKAKPDELLDMTKRLANMVSAHFTDEVRILEEIGYPGAHQHHTIHQAELAKATSLLSQDGVSSKAIFLFVLNNVVIDHMLDSDVEYFPVLQEYLKTKTP